jgi:hypothetical protein
MPKSDKSRPSSTSGKLKGANCHKSPLKNLHALDTRAYRTNPMLYAAAALEVYNINKSKGTVGKSPWIDQILNGIPDATD